MQDLQKELKNLLADRVHRYAIALSILFFFLGLVILLVKIWSLPPLLPLFYHRPWGTQQLGTPQQLLLVLALSGLVLVANLAMSMVLYKNVILLSRILLWVSVLTSFLAALAVVRVILLIS